MSESRRATRYTAFFEAADKAEKSSAAANRKKSPARTKETAASAVAATTKEVKKEARKSPARVENVTKKEEKEIKKERKASKSPARTRAPSKSRKASKSPARVPKKEKAATVTKKEEKEDNKKSSKKGKTSPSIVIEKMSTKNLSPKSKEKASKSSKKKSIIDVESDDNLSPLSKRRTRADTAAERKSASASVSHSVVDQSPEYSDLDDPDISFKKRRGASTLDEIKQYGGTIGCLALLILYPILAYSLQYFCNARFCEIRQPNWLDFQKLSTWYNLDLVKIVIPFLISTALLNIFPLGRVSKLHNDRGYAEYHFNGLTLSILALSAVIGAEYMKYSVIDVIYRNYNQLLIILLLKSIIQSVALIIRSRYVPQSHLNPFAKTGNVIQDFFIGREINPKLFSVIDVKLSQYHVSLITTLALNGIFIYRNVKLPSLPVTEITTQQWHEKALYLAQNARFEVVPLVISSLIIIYIIDLLIFEHHLSKTFELQYEGCGAGLLLRYAIFPFNFSLIAKYALEYRVKLPWYTLTIIAVIFVAALITKRLANKTKHDFRINPTSAKSLGEFDS